MSAKRKAPHVRDFMTRLPREVEFCDNGAEALTLMEQSKIHHLPVMKGWRLTGIVTQRDLLMARLEHGDAWRNLSLEEFCQRDVLTVEPMAGIDLVARDMLGRGVDSAVVVDGDIVVGIFTATDALRALTELFGSSQ